ncbi:hypothetical protein [Roseiconus lacunae]|uniref:hypothetical protein n=1 Tax=Roseiconus lacunae TaxID=2605694 RepID=UPI0011F23719|nr:hypothetical protein [Roseiconus lacunae]
MLKKVLLAVVVCIGSFAISQSTAQADDCYRGRRGHVHHRHYNYRPPVRYSSSIYSARSPYYRPPISRSPYYGAYRYPYGGSYIGRSYIGPGVGIGYNSFSPYRGSGISIGIGF